MTASYFFQLLVNGIIAGCGYALVAVGWTILLGTARLANFAHGTMYMVAAFVIWFVMSSLGLGYFPAILISMLVLATMGLATQLLLNRMIVEQNMTSIMIVTLGISYVLQGAAALLFSGRPQNIDSPLRPIRFVVSDVRFTLQDVAIVVLTLVLYAVVWSVRNKTKLGAWMRALAEDSKLAQLFGVNTKVLFGGIFMFEAVSVALAAGMIAPRSPILTSMGFQEVILTFVIVVFGGVGSVTGALLAGIGMGVFMAFFSALVSSAYALAALFALMLVVLLVRPGGLAKV
jgi:branched-chain amino acid transport system permease protein